MTTYLISYSFAKHGSSGFGRLYANVPDGQKLTMADIETLEHQIKTNNAFLGVTTIAVSELPGGVGR